MRVLGIETSCDETGVAIYDEHEGLLANQLYSQVKLHADYGGVVPELASRDHIRKTIPLIKLTMKQANLSSSDIHGVAYTAGPGLVGALMVGSTIGHALAYAWKVPAIAINHMEGHILAPMLESNSPSFPCVALLVSGGHTQLIAASGIGKYQLLGESIDDAVGESFDKIAKLLGLGYPGGPVLECLARQGIPGRYIFPRPMIKQSELAFSFSGLKTFTANLFHSSNINNQTRADIARGFEDAVIDILTIKCRCALNITGFSNLLISGGVSANLALRSSLKKMVDHRGGKIFYPSLEFCTDNGAMIAYAGMLRLKSESQKNLFISVKPRWLIEELSPITSC